MSLTDGSTALYGSAASVDEQRRALTAGQVPVAIYGLGKMGLPLAAVYADVTGNVTGVDIDEAVVERVNRGECPIKGEPGLPELVASSVASGSLVASADPVEAADAASLHVVIVPTEIRDETVPDLSTLRTAVTDVGAGLDRGDLVIVESTVPPRTCRTVVEPILAAESGLSSGEFGVAFCPERTSSGRALRDIRGAYPKVVGGIDDESTRVAELVYGELTSNEVLAVSDVTVAECVKVFEGIYRDVNIALANELARFTDELGVDVNEAIDVANTQPYCDLHRPGPGVGGHCIPYYPYFLLTPFSTDAPLVETARQINDGMPLFTVGKVVERLAEANVRIEDATVALLGVAYRAGVEETRKTPARPIAQRLRGLGAQVVGVDPVLDDPGDVPVELVTIDEFVALNPDAAVVLTAAEEFQSIDWGTLADTVIVDARAVLDLDPNEHRVYTIGSG